MNFENFKKIFDSRKKCINLLLENSYIQKKCCYCNSDKIGAMKNNYMCKACKKFSNIFKNTVFLIRLKDKEYLKLELFDDFLYEESKKEYLNFQEIINEAKKIIKIK